MKNIKTEKLYKVKLSETKSTTSLLTGWIYVLFAALFLLLQGQDAFATHAAGSDMTYRCLGGNQYEIEVAFYRDCGGVAEPNNIQINIRSVNLNQNINVTANKIAGTGQEITVPCQTSASTCNGGVSTGIRKFVYRTTVTLSGGATDWKFSYHVCCRNCTITTIQNPCANSSELYVEATLNNLNAPCNSSPTFSNIPIAFVCIGQQFNYNHGVVDANGDSLTYELITPMISSSQNVTWIAPANTLNPISSSTPFTLNAVTGQISFTPNQIQIGIMAIRVKEYRNGQLIGSVIRDIQVYTTSCTNNLPTASGANNSANYQVNACPGQQLCFNITTADADASQTVTLTHNNGIAGATYTITPGNRPSMQFCWTPTEAQVSGNPYTFTVTVQDNACPNNGIQIFSYSVFVHGPSFTVTGTNVSCNGMGNGSATVTLNSAGNHTYSWNTVPVQTGQTATGLSPGTYNVTVTHATGCSLTKPVTITQPALMNASASSTNVSCDENCDGIAIASVSGGVAPYTYLWSNGGTIQQISNLCSGNYSVTVTDANGCTRQSSTSIGIQSSISLSSVITDVACHGDNTGSINLDASNGIIPYSYSWSNGSTSQNLSGVGSGTYTVTVTDAIGCQENLAVSVTQPAVALSAASISSQPVSCFGGNNGSASVTANGGTAPYSYVWNTGSTSSAISGIGSGTYVVIVTDALGCTAMNSVTVNQPAAALSPSISAIQNVNCFGGNNGSINLSVAGGTAPYTYVWNTGSISQDLFNLVSGTYTVTITDANGCTAIQSASVGQPGAVLSGTASASQQVSCFSGSDGSVILTVSGGTSPYTYSWSNGATSQNLAGVGAGIYTVTITDVNGCTGNASASVSQPAAALSGVVNATQNVSCFGGNNGSLSIVFSGGTAPYAFNWNNGATSQNISGLSSGTYTITITDANGCTLVQSAAITQPSAALSASASQSQAVNCFGGNNGQMSVSVNGGTGPYSYSWNNGETTQSINGLANGAYTVTVTDANGCTAISSASISQPSAALSGTATTTSNISCFSGNNGSIDLTVLGGTSPYTFMWSNGSLTEDLSLLPAGNYYVTITDVNGCTAQASAEITQPVGSLAANLNVSQNVACFGGGNGSIDLTVSGGTAPYTYQWNTGETTEDISGLAIGTYTVDITDANGCISSATGIITQPSAALSAGIASSQQVSCFGGADGTLNLTVNGGTSPYSYSWNNGETSQNINNLSSGTYTVTVTDANGCTTEQSGTVTQPSAALIGSAQVTVNISCFSGNNGSIDLTVSGGTVPFTFLWNTGDVTEDVSGLGAGSYTVTITDVNGCITTTNAQITQPAGALSASLSVSQNVLCFAGNSGSLDLTVSDGTAPYTYVWSNGETTEDISGLATGVYTVDITDANGCITSQLAFVNQPNAPLDAQINANQFVNCFGGNNGSVDMNISGGTAPYTFMWSNGETTEDISNLVAGSYTVTVTDANGCSTETTAIITEPAASLSGSVNATIDVACFGGNNGNLDVNVNGGTAPYSFNWSNGETTEDIGNLIAGSYTVTITDINGCTLIVSASVAEPAAALDAALAVASNVNCYGGENGSIDLTVTGGTAPYTFDWSNGETSEDIGNLMAGTYVVVVTDANGCEATGVVTISQPAAPLLGNIVVTSNVFCNGGSNGSLDLSVNGGTAPYTFTWSNGAVTEDLVNLSSGIYTVTITDANGCTTEVTEGIGQPGQQLNAVATIQHVLCFNGNNGLLDVTPSGGTAPYTFQWNTGAVLEDISGLIAGNYTVTISDANGCDTVISFTVTQPAAPLIPVLTVSQNVSCFGGNDGSIQLGVTGGTVPYTYLWSTGEITNDISSLPAGAYTVTVTDANGCNAIITDFVAQPAAPLEAPITVSQQVSCFGGANGTVVANATGGTASYTYQWNNGATTASQNGLAAGTYSVTVTDSLGCTYSASAQVQEPAAPLSVSGSTTIANCLYGEGGTVNIIATGGTPAYSYQWNNGSTSQNLTDLLPGSYTVTVTDVNGCEQVATYTVGNYSVLAMMSGNDTICVGDTTTIYTSYIPGGTYQWYYNGDLINGVTGNTFTTQAGGIYSVSVDVPSCGVFFSDSVEIVVKSVENASISGDQVVCPPAYVQLQATGGVHYHWSPDQSISFINVPNPIVNPIVNTTYTVVVTNEWGCSITMDVDIAVACDTLLVPNGFSPNDDGTNDTYVIDHIDNYPGNKLMVYNRWGNLIYKADNYDNSWDGTCNVSGIYMSKKVPSGTYYMILDLNDNSKPMAGYLIIRR